MRRIDTLGEDDIPDEWIAVLKVDGKEVTRQTVPNGGTITHNGITTKFWGKPNLPSNSNTHSHGN
jgi:hypothetical protein